MTAKFLVDTNILSEPLKSSPNKKVLARLEQHQSELATASVVWHELQFGMHRLPRSKKRSLIEKYLQEVIERTIPILPYDQKAALMHGIWRAKLAARGKTLPFVDVQIASIAHSNRLMLVTRNVGDFEGIPELKLVNWF